MSALVPALSRPYYLAYNESNDVNTTFENTSIARNISIVAREGIVSIPLCVYNSFIQEVNSSRVSSIANNVYHCTLNKNTNEGDIYLHTKNSIYKNLIKGEFCGYTGNSGLLTTIIEDNITWNVGLGYLEAVLKENEAEIVYPMLISTLVCKIARLNTTIEIKPLYPTLHFNALLLNKVPEIKAFFNKLVSVISEIKPILSGYYDAMGPHFQEYQNNLSLIVHNISALPTINNTLTLDMSHKLSTTDIQGFEEWICN